VRQKKNNKGKIHDDNNNTREQKKKVVRKWRPRANLLTGGAWLAALAGVLMPRRNVGWLGGSRVEGPPDFTWSQLAGLDGQHVNVFAIVDHSWSQQDNFQKKRFVNFESNRPKALITT